MPLDVEDRRFVPNAAISWTDNGGPVLLFDQARGSYHSLNKWAAELWRMVESGTSEAGIAAALAERYDAAPETIAADVATFLDSALAGGLIVPRA